MVNNKKINIILALTIAVNLFNFSINMANANNNGSEFYLPKSSIIASKINSVNYTQTIANDTNTTKTIAKPMSAIKPKVEADSKTVPVIKGKINPATKPETKPTVKQNPVINTENSKIPKTNQKATSNAACIDPIISLSNFIKNFNASYSSTFVATLYSLAESKVEIISFNSLEGKIYAKLYKKDLYVLVNPINNKTTSVRITPADGVYNIPDTLIKVFFSNLINELSIKKSV